MELFPMTLTTEHGADPVKAIQSGGGLLDLTGKSRPRCSPT